VTLASAGRLLSVNVGMPQDVEWEGRIVHTGIWKDAVDGRRMVRRLNVDGDGQGDLQGHGGVNRAVFVYQIESYRFWEDVLGRDDFTYGQFGDNFTVEGLADAEVCIGDRYQIGSALFEVSQPRVTCYRVGIRMSEPRMPSLLVAHRRPGFYLRVLEEGEVGAGDAIERVERSPEAMTVAEVDALLYLPGHARRDLIRALRIPALSEGWQGSFRELLEQAPAGETPEPAWTGMRRMRVAAIDRESTTVISVRLVPLDGAPAVPARPGQFLTVRLRLDPGAAPLLRTYSLSGVPNAESYRISVKREPHGAASEYLHTGLPDAHRIVCYSHPGPHDRAFDIAGRLTGEVLEEAGVPTDADYYLCGPGPFMHDIAAALTARGAAPERISTEVFGPADAITPGIADGPARSPHPPAGAPGAGPSISFSRSNLSLAWDASFASLLELAEACDVPVRWSCRTGVCHTCETALVSGEVSYRPDPLEPPAPGTALICCSQPRGEVTLDL
jgi:MOSC domain-containing protein YiiM/ferredoxin-NADP reductase/ferredoxin